MLIPPQEISQNTYQLIQVIIGAITGGLTTIIISIINKYRSKGKQNDDHTKDINHAAAENVKSAQEVNQMFKNLLADERKHSDEVLKQAVTDAVSQAKQDCQEQIDKLEKKITNLRTRLKKYEQAEKAKKARKAKKPAKNKKHA